VEHQRLFIVKHTDLSTFDDLVGKIEQGRNNVQACLIYASLLSQQFEELLRSLSGDFHPRVNGLYAQPDQELMAYLLENSYVILTNTQDRIITLPGHDIWCRRRW
jgi:hypothetical protein